MAHAMRRKHGLGMAALAVMLPRAAPAGTRINRAADLGEFGTAGGVRYRVVAFSAGLPKPENTSRTEVEAYPHMAGILRDWLAANRS